MSLLFDQNLSYRLVGLLATEFPGSEHNSVGTPLSGSRAYSSAVSKRSIVAIEIKTRLVALMAPSHFTHGEAPSIAGRLSRIVERGSR